MKNKKGFTLIELLAVVIILGILMTVGGLAVTRITEGTRKNTFINTAQEYAEAVRTLWTSDSIYCGSKNNISSDVKDGNYYVLIDSKDEKFNYLLEKNNKSPWGNRDIRGYVRVNVSTNPKGQKEIKYYVSITDGIHAIKDNKESDKIKKGDLNMSINSDQASFDKIVKIPFDGKSLTTCGEEGLGTDKEPIAKMVKGDINNPQIGDMFSIKNERFHIYSSTPTTVTGLAEYNLFVGGEYKKDQGWTAYGPEATGIQNSEMKGYIYCDSVGCSMSKGGTKFSNTSNEYRGSIVEEYVKDYHNILTGYGVNIEDTRLITHNELTNIFHCVEYGNCPNTYPWIYSTAYWTSTSEPVICVWYMALGRLEYYPYTLTYVNGVRPVVTINKSEFK